MKLQFFGAKIQSSKLLNSVHCMIGFRRENSKLKVIKSKFILNSFHFLSNFRRENCKIVMKSKCENPFFGAKIQSFQWLSSVHCMISFRRENSNSKIVMKGKYENLIFGVKIQSWKLWNQSLFQVHFIVWVIFGAKIQKVKL